MATPPDVPLPSGYRLYDPGVVQILRQLSIDPLASGLSLYGGSTMNWCMGGDGSWYLGCCAEYQNFFKFRVFKLVGAALTEIPLSDVGEGRGWLGYDLQGYICYSSWQGSQYRPSPVPLRVPGVVPIPIGGSGGGSAGGTYHPINPNAYNASLDGQTFSTGQWLDMAALYHVPVGCLAYVVRCVSLAASADIRARLGTDTQPGQATSNTHGSTQEHEILFVNAGPDGRVWLSVADGQGAVASARVWLTVVGYFI